MFPLSYRTCHVPTILDLSCSHYPIGPIMFPLSHISMLPCGHKYVLFMWIYYLTIILLLLLIIPCTIYLSVYVNISKVQQFVGFGKLKIVNVLIGIGAFFKVLCPLSSKMSFSGRRLCQYNEDDFRFQFWLTLSC